MDIIIGLIIGIVVGGAVVGAIVHLRAKAQAARAVAEMENRAAGAEGTLIELRNQLTAATGELQSVRTQLTEEGKSRVATETQFAAAQASLDEQRTTLDKAKKDLTDAFEALAAKALKGNSEEFINNAKRALDAVLSDTKGDMGGLVNPLKEALRNYDQKIQDIEAKRVDAYSRLSTNLTELSDASISLQQQTTRLEQALRAPGIRGRWGELMLEKVLELSGLTEPIIEVQKTIATEDGAVRPDVVVRLPDKRSIIVDSKAPMNAYFDAMAADRLDTRNQKLLEHAAAVRGHMKKLAQKDYAKQIETSADVVVMFMPGESVLAAALDADRDLLKDSIQYHVYLVTPTTLILALQIIAHTWRQHDLERNAEEIAKVGGELYDRLWVFAEHLQDIREGIEKAAKSYARVVASWEDRVEPGARKLKQLGAAPADKQIRELDPSEPFLPPPPEKPAEGGTAIS